MRSHQQSIAIDKSGAVNASEKLPRHPIGRILDLHPQAGACFWKFAQENGLLQGLPPPDTPYIRSPCIRSASPSETQKAELSNRRCDVNCVQPARNRHPGSTAQSASHEGQTRDPRKAAASDRGQAPLEGSASSVEENLRRDPKAELIIRRGCNG